MSELVETIEKGQHSEKWLLSVLGQPRSVVGNPAKVFASFLSLCAFADKDYACPAYRTIKEHTGMANDTISKAKRQLEEAGLLRTEVKKSSTGNYNYYWLLHPQQLPTPVGATTSSSRSNTSSTRVERKNKEELMEELIEEQSEVVKEDEGVFPLDTQTSISLDSRDARFEHKEETKKSWLEKNQDRQAQINAEIIKEFEGVA